MSRFPSKSDLERRVIIGIDEFNNGKSHPTVPFICVGFTSYPPQPRKRKTLSKGKGFHSNPAYRIRFRKKALEFLRENSNFKYFSIDTSQDEVFSSSLRAIATARLIYETACRIGEQPLVIHDGGPFCLDAEEKIMAVLAEYGLNCDDFHFRKKADSIHHAVQTADRIAYCLGALRYGGLSSGRKWPHRHKKINLAMPPQRIHENELFRFDHSYEDD